MNRKCVLILGRSRQEDREPRRRERGSEREDNSRVEGGGRRFEGYAEARLGERVCPLQMRNGQGWKSQCEG